MPSERMCTVTIRSPPGENDSTRSEHDFHRSSPVSLIRLTTMQPPLYGSVV